MRMKFLPGEHERSDAVDFEPGEEVMDGLLSFARARELTAARFTAISVDSDVALGYFDLEREDYRLSPIREQVEVPTLIGNFALEQSKLKPARICPGGHLGPMPVGDAPVRAWLASMLAG